MIKTTYYKLMMEEETDKFLIAKYKEITTNRKYKNLLKKIKESVYLELTREELDLLNEFPDFYEQYKNR